MRGFCFAFFAFLLVPIPTRGSAQSNAPDSQTLQALLAEVRQMRQDLQVRMTAVERAQILLYRLQAQQTAVARASQRVDNARSKLADLQAARRQMESDIRRLEEQLRTNMSEAESKEIESVNTRMKARLQALEEEEQRTQALASEAEEQLRIEEAKLGRLQDQLDRLDQSLEVSPPQPPTGPR